MNQSSLAHIMTIWGVWGTVPGGDSGGAAAQPSPGGKLPQMLGAPQPKQLCFYLFLQHRLALLPFLAELHIWGLVPPTFPVIPQGAASPLQHSQALCSLNCFLLFMQRQHPSGELTSFFSGHLQALTEQQRNTQQILVPHSQSSQLSLTCSSSLLVLGMQLSLLLLLLPVLSVPLPHSALHRCHTVPPKQEGPSLLWMGSLCPLCLSGPGITQAVPLPPSPQPELQAPTCKISLVHVTLLLGCAHKCGFNPL